MHYQKQKRVQIDQCNICGTKTRLTWDHVPPKSCRNDSPVEYSELFGELKHEPGLINFKHFISQNGIKFRSICEVCNNTLLGRNYDLELTQLTNYINELLTAKIALPQNLSYKAKINKLARAVVGHILSAKNEYDELSLIDKALRSFFLDPSAMPPKSYKLLFRIYPFNTIFIIRDILVKNVLSNKAIEIPDGVISCLSFYPIAFIINDGQSSCGMIDIFSLCSNDIDDEVELKIDLLSYKYPNIDKPRHPIWPCNISDDEDGTCIAIVTDNVDYSVIAKKR